jgi:hypothetical protein
LKSFMEIWCKNGKLVSWMFLGFCKIVMWTDPCASCQVILHPIEQKHIPLSNKTLCQIDL